VLKTNVSFFNISSESQTFVPSVSKLLNARCNERFWLQPDSASRLYLGIRHKCLSFKHFLTPNVNCLLCKTLAAIYWMHLRVNLICINFFAYKNAITACCSLGEDFGGNVAVFNVYKWRHRDVIVTKLTAATQN